MAIYIEITKIKDIDNIHYYLVESKNFGYPSLFNIGIDDHKHRLYFFKNGINEHAEYEIDLNNLDEIPSCDWIDRGLALRVIRKAYYAFQQKKYDNFISYQA